jgi:hypothetical protein
LEIPVEDAVVGGYCTCNVLKKLEYLLMIRQLAGTTRVFLEIPVVADIYYRYAIVSQMYENGRRAEVNNHIYAPLEKGQGRTFFTHINIASTHAEVKRIERNFFVTVTYVYPQHVSPHHLCKTACEGFQKRKCALLSPLEKG